MSEAAPAKVNLDLRVLKRRADGYHDLDSVVVFVDVADRITIRPDARLELELTGPFAPAIIAEPDNLVLRAARLLAGHCVRPPAVRIVLEKRIPVAAGLGGGSADAAAVLRALCRLWRLTLPYEELHGLALRLGADVPVCLARRPARMRGIGERLEFLDDLPSLLLLLVNPGEGVPTRRVFAGLDATCLRPGAADAGAPARGDMLTWLRARTNDLEAPARRIAPAIGAVLEALGVQPGCLLARMSGSGATCFGLFADERALQRAAAEVQRAYPAWWVTPARSLSGS